jgi:hypothetical protein
MMKRDWLVLFFILSGCFIIPSCNKNEKQMLVTTSTVTKILVTTAEVSGEILDLGEGATQYGHCYSTRANPEIIDTKTELGAPVIGNFTSNLTGLVPESNYYVKAYISRGKKVVYGNEVSFTTASATPPELTTVVITSITKNSAISGGNITNEGGTPVTARGICWSVVSNPTIANNKTSDGTGPDSYGSTLTGLISDTKYYVRAYAINGGGIAYGNELNFTTSPEAAAVPTVATAPITSVTANSAVSGGEVTNEGGASVTSRGVCWSTSVNPTVTNSKTMDGTGSGSFVSNVINLLPLTTYYIRAYAINSVGTSYGNELNFITSDLLNKPPTAGISAATSITNTTAILNGAVNARGNSTSVTFEYGPTILYGSTAIADQSPVTGNSPTSVSVAIASLPPNTPYHFRIKAVNSYGTAYSDDMTFTTLQMPISATEPVTSITNTSATLNGTVNAINLSTSVTFEYGLTISYGLTQAASPNPVTGGTPTHVSVNLIGLTPGSTYHFRVKAVSSGGTTYGDDKLFTTLCTEPSATTGTVTDIGEITAKLNGTINANSFSTNVTFEYGTTINYGNIVTPIPNPITGNSNTNVSVTLTGLAPSTLYHFRVNASNCGGTIYGTDQTFITLSETAINDTLLLCYSKLHDYVEFMYLFDAIYSNNYPAPPTHNWSYIYTHTETSYDLNVLNLWSMAYDIIYKINFVIISSEIVISDPSLRNGIISQAKAIRAYLYYNLLIWFDGVPLELGNYEDLNPRVSATELMTQINQDAEVAALYLPWTWPTSDNFRVTQSFARGLLVRASLYNNNNSDALTNNLQIINSGLYTLSTEIDNFTSTNSEIFWGFPKGHIAEFYTFFTKGSFVPAIRFTESYLIATETYFKLGNTASALSYVNALMVRRGLSPLPSLSYDDIFQQWNAELAKEGSMFITLKRFNKAKSVLSIADYRLVLPIPQNILNKNPNVYQNPGY